MRLRVCLLTEIKRYKVLLELELECYSTFFDCPKITPPPPPQKKKKKKNTKKKKQKKKNYKLGKVCGDFCQKERMS